MGSLRDYGSSFRREPRRDVLTGKKRGGFGRRLAVQSLCAVALFFLVAGFIGADNLFGEGARYVVGQGVAAANSWIDWGGAADVDADADNPATVVDSNAVPSFTAPASGVVVSELAIAVSGFATEKGILIQGTAGQNVKAAATGSVAYLGSNEQGYIVEIVHSGGFSSVYQCISSITVGSGDELKAGDIIGTVDNGEVTFSLLKDGVEVDPLEYLFK